MINSLWIAKTGMEAQQMQLDVISNNLANVSTNGFKKSHAVFEDLIYQNLRQTGAKGPVAKVPFDGGTRRQSGEVRAKKTEAVRA